MVLLCCRPLTHEEIAQRREEVRQKHLAKSAVEAEAAETKDETLGGTLLGLISRSPILERVYAIFLQLGGPRGGGGGGAKNITKRL